MKKQTAIRWVPGRYQITGVEIKHLARIYDHFEKTLGGHVIAATKTDANSMCQWEVLASTQHKGMATYKVTTYGTIPTVELKATALPDVNA